MVTKPWNLDHYHRVKLHVGDFLWSTCVHKFFKYLCVCDHQNKLQSLVQLSFLYLAISQKDPGIWFSDLIEFFIGCLNFNYFFFPEHSIFALVASCGRQTITQAKCSCFPFIVTCYGHQTLKFRSLPQSEITCWWLFVITMRTQIFQVFMCLWSPN